MSEVHCSKCGYEDTPDADIEDILNGYKCCGRCGEELPVHDSANELKLERVDSKQEHDELLRDYLK